MSQMAKRQLSVRLTMLLAVVCVVFLLIGGAANAEGPPPPTTEYSVVEGDTLWSIAARQPRGNRDIRNLVADIRELNGLESSMIHPGQILRIPKS